MPLHIKIRPRNVGKSNSRFERVIHKTRQFTRFRKFNSRKKAQKAQKIRMLDHKVLLEAISLRSRLSLLRILRFFAANTDPLGINRQ
jgi:hypothetical protein